MPEHYRSTSEQIEGSRNEEEIKKITSERCGEEFREISDEVKEMSDAAFRLDQVRSYLEDMSLAMAIESLPENDRKKFARRIRPSLNPDKTVSETENTWGTLVQDRIVEGKLPEGMVETMDVGKTTREERMRSMMNLIDDVQVRRLENLQEKLSNFFREYHLNVEGAADLSSISSKSIIGNIERAKRNRLLELRNDNS